MTVSNSNNFSQTRNEIINLAYSVIGVKTLHRELSAEEVNEASTVLNAMIKSWKAKGENLWKSAEGTLFLSTSQERYRLDGTTANATESFNQTTTTVAALSGATSLTVASATGFTIGYNIGILQNNGTTHWTTITNVVGLVITINSALTDDVASGNIVYVYETKITRPERISSCRLKTAGGSESPLEMIARKTYFDLSNKSNSGKPTQAFYDKQLSYGDLYIYPTSDLETDTIKFTFQKMFFDFDTAADDPDFPVEWIKPIYMQLAVDLARIKQKELQYRQLLKQEADEVLADVEGYDKETTSAFIQPDMEDY